MSHEQAVSTFRVPPSAFKKLTPPWFRSKPAAWQIIVSAIGTHPFTHLEIYTNAVLLQLGMSDPAKVQMEKIRWLRLPVMASTNHHDLMVQNCRDIEVKPAILDCGFRRSF